MVTVSEVITKKLNESAFLADGLSEGLINISALARKLQPEISQEVGKPVTAAALTMALKRIADSQARQEFGKSGQLIKNLTVKSGLAEYTFANSSGLRKAIIKLAEQSEARGEQLIAISQGTTETTIILSTQLEDLVKRLFASENLRSSYSDLAAISLNQNDATVETPGVYYQVLRRLAWAGINIVEVASTYTELTIVFRGQDITKAFEVLHTI